MTSILLQLGKRETPCHERHAESGGSAAVKHVRLG